MATSASLVPARWLLLLEQAQQDTQPPPMEPPRPAWFAGSKMQPHSDCRHVGFEKAEVTPAASQADEVDSRTMQSKLVSDLGFLAGEVLTRRSDRRLIFRRLSALMACRQQCLIKRRRWRGRAA